ncbi:hypothetical protein [Lysinibacillus fusiformis]|jgi:hypothetical protein|uniref:hypothetical protein n=1 Tax=Lysinibacillus fusiformis TaxID=28031 RepID=UPI003D070DBA
MQNETKFHRVVVLCHRCNAPTKLPEAVERNIDKFESFDCWDCAEKVPITKDLINFIKATRSVDE